MDNPEGMMLQLDAFIRSIGVKRSTPHALLLGAGASVSSGIPSAQACIWEWKRSIFLTNNPGLESQFAELSLPSIQQRIQSWLDRQGYFPQKNTQEEYGFYIEHCFPIADDRRAYFHEKIRSAKPHIGYRLICHLSEAGLLRSVWTTNFDSLTARAAANFEITPIEIGIDSKERITRQETKGDLLCVSLHGDYRYDNLKNTPQELQEQEVALRAALIDELRNTSLIVCGYSGRDQSIMAALHTAYGQMGSGSLYWCGFSDGDVPKHIAELIQHACSHGRRAFYIPSLGFDDVFVRLSLHCLEGKPREAARAGIAELASRKILERTPFQVATFTQSGVVKSNAFELECPSEVLAFELKEWPVGKVWNTLRGLVAERQIVAVPFKGKVLALGTIDEIKAAFRDNIKGQIQRTPIGPNELCYEDGAVVSLMREALVRSLSQATGISSDRSRELWFGTAVKTMRQNGLQCHAHESVQVFLRQIGSIQYIVLKPSIKVLDDSGNDVPPEIANPVKLGILGYQHNKPFNQAMNNWRKHLFGNEKTTIFEFPQKCGSTFKFTVRKVPAFGQIGVPRGRPFVNISDAMRPLIKHRGFELDEPQLVFSNKAGKGTVKDVHPIRGILNNRPFDYPLTSLGLSPSLRIAVVCPRHEATILHAYLHKAHQSHQPTRNEQDYLQSYPGFQQAYGLPLELPECDGPGWVNCPEPTSNDPQKGAIEIAKHINSSVENLLSTYSPHVILIFFPDRWSQFRGYKDENESFDVHDFVKSFCVQRGIASQFLNQKTLADSYQCRVWWWLSLALYVKGMRTPWVLDSLNEDTAYVGLGFSIDQHGDKGNHVVLGCSHIYSARGEGLQYRLSKVENPIIRQGNPFMSRDDARRVGENIRQLFFDARMKLPRRVVLHKRTPFLREEREGLIDGLSGVETIDMIEIQVDSVLRYVASVQGRSGSVDEDNYPVHRGTTLKLDDFTALLWVHGSTTALNPHFKYYQGKRRIPAPLVLRRHVGHTDLSEIATEILGLSKMDWNTFDLYTKLPATLQSSNEIARIGSLLQRFGTSSYDYRLFI
ncbi:MAG: SIR2 family protein [Desulfurivibrionaceae bacterium]|nr:SIR2 family protein [Desulfurivibrionaceae bacterium]